MPDLLIELFSEEIPARMQTRAAEDLKKLVTDGLVEAGLTYRSAGAFSTPRRLTLSVEGLTARSADTREERRGPKVGAPDKAVEGFARGAGVDRAALETRDTGKGEFYFAVVETKGREAAGIVAEVLEAAIRNFPWPKSMRWGSGSLRWVRPLHAILCILTDESGAQVVPLTVDGVTAGDRTQGHRFMGGAPFSVTSFDDYEAKLKHAHVVLRADERAELIESDAANRAFALGLEVVEDPGLLREVAGLVEWPVVLMGEIGADFLELPPEVLTTSMKEHQKFFSVRDPKTGKVLRFVTVANIETADDGATILAGNQKVLAARLSDAKFFWENDLRVAKAGMAPWRASLDNVTFHSKLGSEGARITRIAALAQGLARQLGADPAQAQEAAELSKLDLASEMVYEFPELQGVMGRYYALEAGHDAAVADAARDHYAPLGPSDDVPSAPVSVAVALADKLDKLTGFWAIDEKPTGSKDPFALRRAALGVIRLVLGNGLRLPLLQAIDAWSEAALRAFAASGKMVIVQQSEAEGGGSFGAHGDMLLDLAGKGFETVSLMTYTPADAEASPQDFAAEHSEDLVELSLPHVAQVKDDLMGFIHDRLKVHLRDEGVRHDVIDACLAMPGRDDLVLLVARAHALQAFLSTDDGENLLQGFKRANNILTQAEEKDGVEYSFGADAKFSETEAEKALFAALDGAEPQITAATGGEDFGAAMQALAGLRAPIDAFFDTVQVNADNEVLRRNRLNLLSRIRQLCLNVADLRRIEG